MERNAEERRILRCHISPEEQDTLIRLPFELPRAVERMDIALRQSDRHAGIG
jgi:hypothetical protein